MKYVILFILFLISSTLPAQEYFLKFGLKDGDIFQGVIIEDCSLESKKRYCVEIVGEFLNWGEIQIVSGRIECIHYQYETDNDTKVILFIYDYSDKNECIEHFINMLTHYVDNIKRT